MQTWGKHANSIQTVASASSWLFSSMYNQKTMKQSYSKTCCIYTYQINTLSHIIPGSSFSLKKLDLQSTYLDKDRMAHTRDVWLRKSPFGVILWEILKKIRKRSTLFSLEKSNGEPYLLQKKILNWLIGMEHPESGWRKCDYCYWIIEYKV